MINKKLFTVIIAIVTIVSFSACAGEDVVASLENNNTNTNNSITEQTSDEDNPTIADNSNSEVSPSSNATAESSTAPQQPELQEEASSPNEVAKQPVEAPNSEVQRVASTKSGGITQAEAEAIYSAAFPGAPIDIVKLEDNNSVYYIQGITNSTKYIMKVSVSDGSIVMSKSIDINGNNQGSGYNNNNGNNYSSSQENSQSTGGSISQADAEAIFSAQYPSAPIDIVKLQDDGTVYYIQGITNSIKYMMKVSVSDGSIIMNKSVEIGGNNNNSNNNRSGNSNRGNNKGNNYNYRGR